MHFSREKFTIQFLPIFTLLAALASAVCIYLFSIWFGSINQDEGWYLYAAQSVARGEFPYRDFFFTQGPLHPLFYGSFSKLWSSFGILGGRVFTAILGFLSCVFAALLARRALPKPSASLAALIAFSMTACNLYHAYFTTLPKTYALSALFVNMGFWVLTYVTPRGAPRTLESSLMALPAGFLLSLAAGTRLSLGLLLPITALLLLVTYKKNGLAFVWFSLGAAIGLLLIYGKPILEEYDVFLFSQTFHTARNGGHDLFLIAGSLSRIVRAYLPIFLLGAWLLLHWCSVIPKMQKAELRPDPPCLSAFWPRIYFGGAFAVFLLHLCSPNPYDDYQVPVMGLFAAAFASWFVQSMKRDAIRKTTAAFWVFTTLFLSFGSPLAQDWMIQKIDRFWVIKKPQSDVQQIHEVGKAIRKLTGNNDLLLTQDTYLAVEAGMRVPKGFEMGPFSYFPDLTDEQAKRYHVLNRSRLVHELETADATVAAYSGYGLAIQSPIMDEVPPGERTAMIKKLLERFPVMQTISDFGQNKTLLTILSQSPNN